MRCNTHALAQRWWNRSGVDWARERDGHTERCQESRTGYLTVDFGLLGVLAWLSAPPLSTVSPSERSPHLLSSHTHLPHALSPYNPLSLSLHTHVSPECRPLTPSLTRPACDEGVILLDAAMEKREGRREMKRRVLWRYVQVGWGRRFGVEPVRIKLTIFIHSHSPSAVCVCPILSGDETIEAHTCTMQSTAACSLTRTDATATILSSTSGAMWLVRDQAEWHAALSPTLFDIWGWDNFNWLINDCILTWTAVINWYGCWGWHQNCILAGYTYVKNLKG